MKNDVKVLHKNNTLVRGKYDLKTVEFKIYSFVLHEMQKHDSERIINKNEDSIKIKMYSDDFLEIFKNDKQYIKRNRLENIFESLRVKKVKYYVMNDNTNVFDWSVFGFISRYDYLSEDKSFILKIERTIYDMVKNYPEGYTPLNLKLLLTLDGKYTFRFYELLRLWTGTKSKINYSIDELKEFLALENKKAYETYANFKNKVIFPAIKELNETGKFKIDYKEVKNGRKVSSIDFIVEDLEPRRYFSEKSNETDTKKSLECIDMPKIVEDDFDYSQNPLPIKPIKNLYEEIDMDMLKVQVQKLFKKDFCNIDFSLEHNQEAFDYAVGFATEKDDVEIVGMKQYSYFKKTLNILLEKAEKKELEIFMNNIENDLFW